MDRRRQLRSDQGSRRGAPNKRTAARGSCGRENHSGRAFFAQLLITHWRTDGHSSSANAFQARADRRRVGCARRDSPWRASHTGRDQPRHRTRPPRARFFRRDRGLRGHRGDRKTGVGTRGPQGDGDVFGGARGAPRPKDLRSVAPPDARLSPAGPPWHLDATSWITRGLRRWNAGRPRGSCRDLRPDSLVAAGRQDQVIEREAFFEQDEGELRKLCKPHGRGSWFDRGDKYSDAGDLEWGTDHTRCAAQGRLGQKYYGKPS